MCAGLVRISRGLLMEARDMDRYTKPKPVYYPHKRSKRQRVNLIIDIAICVILAGSIIALVVGLTR